MRRSFLLILLAILACGCTSTNRALFPPQPGQPQADVVVFSNHWHTGVIVRTKNLPHTLRTDLKEFAAYPYVAIGWGDTDFYRAAHVTPFMAVRALFFSRGVVLLVIGLPLEPEAAFEPSVDVYRIHGSRDGFEKMVSAIAGSFTREAGRAVDRGPGGEGFSHFYAGVGRYSAVDTCNVWTAKMLRAAGLPVSPTYAITADNVEYQISRIPGALKNGRPFPPARLGPHVPVARGNRPGV